MLCKKKISVTQKKGKHLHGCLKFTALDYSTLFVLTCYGLTDMVRGWALKRPSDGKLKLANSCWQTQVGVCERCKNSRQTRW